MSDKDQPEKILRYYTGRRLEKGKLVHFFADHDPDDNEKPYPRVYWPKSRDKHFTGAVIGRLYDMSDGIPRLWGEAEQGSIDAETCVQWQLEDKAAYAQKMDKSAAKHPELDDLLDSLRHHRANLRTHNAQSAFDVWLMQQVRK